MSEIQLMLDDCINRESKLSDWEWVFIQSVQEQFISTGFITDKQEEKLEKIWDKVTA